VVGMEGRVVGDGGQIPDGPVVHCKSFDSYPQKNGNLL
jgi:hypothetical protein